MAHSYRWDVELNTCELCGVFQWPTQMGAISGAILMNWVG